MLKINDLEFKTSVNEMNVWEFEQISFIFSDQTNHNFIDKYLSILKILGATEEFLDELTEDDLFKFVKALNVDTPVKKKKIKSFKIGDRTYVSHTVKEFKLTARQLGLIEKVTKNGINTFGKMLGVIFLEVGELHGRSIDIKHIEEKAELFKQLNAGKYLPYVVYITDKITKKMNKIW